MAAAEGPSQRRGTVAVARYHSAAGHPTCQYQFDRATPGRESAGSTHGAEVVYVFGTMGRPGDTVAWSDADRKASDVGWVRQHLKVPR